MIHSANVVQQLQNSASKLTKLPNEQSRVDMCKIFLIAPAVQRDHRVKLPTSSTCLIRTRRSEGLSMTRKVSLVVKTIT